MTATSTFWRLAGKVPRVQRVELLDVPELDVRYVNVPKTGTGTVRMQVYRQLCDAAGRDLPRSILWERTRWVRIGRLGDLEPRFTFAFCRDPYARLASVYRHKIVKPRSEGRRVSPLFVLYGRRFRLDMTFPDFVRAVAAVPDDRAEKHFRSQTRSLHHEGVLVVDYLGRVERFAETWAEVVTRSRLEPLRRGYNRTAEDTPFELGDWYDTELLSIVNERYREDFELLGYPQLTSV